MRGLFRSIPATPVLSFLVAWVCLAPARAAVPCGVVDLTDASHGALSKSAATPTHTHLTADGHFEIRYFTDSHEAVPAMRAAGSPVPEFVRMAESALSRAWNLVVDSLGYPEPVGCSDGRYRVDLREPGAVMPQYQGAYGLTIQCRRGRSYMVVENDFRKYSNGRFYDFITLSPDGRSYRNYAEDWQAGLDVTIAHEFFHAVQFSMTGRIEGFWTEASAVWIEERAHPENNDYLQYLRHAVMHPETTLTYLPGREDYAVNLHPYAEGIWGQHLAWLHGDDVIRESWELLASRMAGPSTLFHRLLESREGGMEKAFVSFALSQLMSGKRHSERHSSFADARYFPDLPLRRTLTAGSAAGLTLKPMAFTRWRLHAGTTARHRITIGGKGDWTALVLSASAALGEPEILVLRAGEEDMAEAFVELQAGREYHLLICNHGAKGIVDLNVGFHSWDQTGTWALSHARPWDGAFGSRGFRAIYQVFDSFRALNYGDVGDTGPALEEGERLWYWSNELLAWSSVWEERADALPKPTEVWPHSHFAAIEAAPEEKLKRQEDPSGSSIYVMRFSGGSPLKGQGFLLVQEALLGRRYRLRSWDHRGRELPVQGLRLSGPGTTLPSGRVYELRELRLNP